MGDRASRRFEAPVQLAAARPSRLLIIDPLSGPFAGVGANLLKHFQFVADLVNPQQLAGPGVKFEMVSFDNKASPQEIADGVEAGHRSRAFATWCRATAPERRWH